MKSFPGFDTKYNTKSFSYSKSPGSLVELQRQRHKLTIFFFIYNGQLLYLTLDLWYLSCLKLLSSYDIK